MRLVVILSPELEDETLRGACPELNDETLRGACPELKDEILRCAQNDKAKGSE
jgi:hypothetical protein